MDESFRVKVSLVFLIGSFAGVLLCGFGVGRACRWYLEQQLQIVAGASLATAPRVETTHLPRPIIRKGKRVPQTEYTSKYFDTAATYSSDSLLARRSDAGREDAEFEIGMEGATIDREVGEEKHDEEEDEDYEPAGQHLLVDIDNVDGNFLNSQSMLAQAMIDLMELSDATLLSYHCHGLEPVGVSCVGVLLESHVSFHTWPIPGVITFDLFTCGSTSLLPLLPAIKELFGVPRHPSVDRPVVLWAYKERGFRRKQGNIDRYGDIMHFLYGAIEFDMKELVTSVETDFQQIEVYDDLNPRFRTLEDYKRSLIQDGSYESQHPEHFKPDRVIFLDGIMQSRLHGEAAYHEALVHPAMLTHENPKRVAIIGGGEGATLREVLKHKTVETVTMVEIDEEMVITSRTHIPQWSDCSKLVGSADSCFNDPRAEVYYTDAIAWFIENFGGESDLREKYDVIIMDALYVGNA